jgi:hypothetical protein
MITDWKLKLMQVLDEVGQAEGIWFSPWAGISPEEQAEIEHEQARYRLGDRPAFTAPKVRPLRLRFAQCCSRCVFYGGTTSKFGYCEKFVCSVDVTEVCDDFQEDER